MIRIMPNGGSVIAEDIVTLTESQRKKLESSQLSKRVDTLCKDLHIESWEVRTNGNIDTHVISSTMDRYDDEVRSRLERIHHEFLQGIDKMELEKVVDPEDADNENEELEFVKSLLEDFDNDTPILGAEIMVQIPGLPIATNAGRISGDTLKNLLNAYLECYDK